MCRLLFIQSVSADGPSLVQRALGARPVDMSALDPLKSQPAFESVSWDVANQSLCPTAAGVAVKKAAAQQSAVPPAQRPSGKQKRGKKAKQRA